MTQVDGQGTIKIKMYEIDEASGLGSKVLRAARRQSKTDRRTDTDARAKRRFIHSKAPIDQGREGRRRQGNSSNTSNTLTRLDSLRTSILMTE